MTTMIALVGEQPLPNFLPVRHYRPDDLLLVYTERTKPHYERLKAVLEKEVKIHELETDAYNIVLITKALNQKLDKLAGSAPSSLTFNLTGGTKAMLLAAYQVAAQRNAPVFYLQSEKGQSVVDLYGWSNRQASYESRQQLSEHLTLREMLDLHIGQGEDAAGKKRWKEADPKKIRSDSGALFELAVAQALSDHGYEVICGVKDSRSQIDIDVMIRYQNQIAIIEAKIDGEARTLKGVQQLSTAMNYLRGTYTKQFLIINDKAYGDQEKICQLLNIQIISLLEYRKDKKYLEEGDRKKLEKAVDSIIKKEENASKDEAEKK